MRKKDQTRRNPTLRQLTLNRFPPFPHSTTIPRRRRRRPPPVLVVAPDLDG